MTSYIIRRLIQSVLVLIIVTMVVFFCMRLLPGDPILMLITQDELADTSPERVEALRREHGLDKPVMAQYVIWVKDILRGDLRVWMGVSKPIRLVWSACPFLRPESLLLCPIYVMSGFRETAR